MLGDGAYGEVYEGRLTGGPLDGARVVCKRAKDGAAAADPPPAPGGGPGDGWRHPAEAASAVLRRRREDWELAGRYLETEGLVNQLVRRRCPPGVAAPYLGHAWLNGRRWLVWEHMGAVETLEEVLVRCGDARSLAPLAEALGEPAPRDSDDITGRQRILDRVARDLLFACLAVQRAGVCHRDVKPLNLLVSHRQLVLIDFGSAAAMTLPGRPGFDYGKWPCDVRYAPPEMRVDPDYWGRFDVYSVALLLVRVAFDPLWSGQAFDEFTETFHEDAGYDLDRWLSDLARAEWADGGRRAPAPRGGGHGGDNGGGGAAQDPDRGVRAAAAAAAAAEQLCASLRAAAGGDGVEAGDPDEVYVRLAELSCRAGRRSTFCSLLPGLRALARSGGGGSGVCWSTLRQMLAPDPQHRLAPDQALARVVCGRGPASLHLPATTPG